MTLVDFATAAQRLLPALERLESLLDSEIEALGSGDLDALNQHTQGKRRLLRELELEVAQLQVPAGGGEVASADWQRMLTRLARCHQLNQAIGATLSTQLRHNAALLSLLGHSPEPCGYGPAAARGQALPTGRGRALAVG